jgi:hypothetical protein
MEAVTANRTFEELSRLFDLYRRSELNRRYYGKRAEFFERLQTISLVTAAFLSAVALGLLLALEWPWVRYTAALLAGLSAVVTTVVQYFKWDEQARQFYFLHHSYGNLFAQLEALMSDIRRTDEITEQQIGASKSLHDAYGRIEVLDELDPKEELIRALEEKVERWKRRFESSSPRTIFGPACSAKDGFSQPETNTPGSQRVYGEGSAFLRKFLLLIEWWPYPSTNFFLGAPFDAASRGGTPAA